MMSPVDKSTDGNESDEMFITFACCSAPARKVLAGYGFLGGLGLWDSHNE